MPKSTLCTVTAFSVVVVALLVGCNRAQDPAINTKVTKENFDAISDGMTVSEVKAILGEPYSVTKPAREGTRETVIVNYVEVDEHHSWKAFLGDLDEDAKRIDVGFKDGKVAIKDQTGL